jgi:hypothetical protein
MRERDESDAGDRESESRAEPFARDAVEDAFAGGRVDPSVVEASVDALFERFEEDTPEEVMLADRYPSEAEVVPTPPAFDAFAADVDDRLPERSVDDQTGDADDEDGGLGDAIGDADDAGEGAGDWMRAADDPVPEPDDVVGFEDAPEPPHAEGAAANDPSEATGGSWSTGLAPMEIEEWSPSHRPVGARVADPDADDAFEWVSDPVDPELGASETVLADPERASALAGEPAKEDRVEGVLSRLRSSFPF